MDEPDREEIVPIEHIARSIMVMRGQRILLDTDLAALYGVPTKRFNEAVKRNRRRFPNDFAFQLTADEFAGLRSAARPDESQLIDLERQNNWSQFATSSSHHRGATYRPWAFTEHGAIMAATILNSPRAVEVSVFVVRAFLQLRDLLASNQELAQRLDELDQRLSRKLDTHEEAIAGILRALRQLMNPPVRAIGFTANLNEKG